jgi:uncharacterized protein
LTPIFIDTAYVIALINRRDQYQLQALELAQRYAGHPLLVTSAVLIEIGNALSKQYKPQAVAILEQFFAAAEIELVHLTPELFAQAFQLYKQDQDKEWGLVDCASFIVMRNRGVYHALTPDQHFVQAGFEVLMKTPS